jgi:hypothetical protein
MNQQDRLSEDKVDWKTHINATTLLKNEVVNVIVKYRIGERINIDNSNYPCTSFLGINGQITIRDLSKKQKFFSNTLLKECDQIQLNTNILSRGSKTVRIRDLYFFYAMVYFQVGGITYRLQSNKGYLEFGVSTSEYRKLLSKVEV